MTVKQAPRRRKNDLQQTRDTIRQSWSNQEREKRRQLAATQRQVLLSVIFPQPIAVPARVA